MARTTPAEVKAITGSTVLDSVIDPFIDIATIVIDKVASKCPKLTDAELDAGETYYAAHLFVTSKVGEASAQLKSEKFENYSKSVKSGSDDGMGVLSTSFGQTANTITDGCLVELDKRKSKIGFFGEA